MGAFRLSAFADEYAESVDEQLDALVRFGIGSIELRHLNGRNLSVLSEEVIRETKRKMDFCGITASAIGSPIGKIRLDDDMDDHMEMAKHVFAAANLLGTEYVRMFSFYAPDGEEIADHKSEVFDALGRLVSIAREYGITLCHENEAKIYGDTPARCREICDHFDGEIKCVFDMGNFVLEGVDPYPDAYLLLQKHIAYFHIKDALAEGAVVPAGCGDAKIKEILLAHTAYTDDSFFVSLEPHLQTFSGLNALVGRPFRNPYQYPDAKSAFADAVARWKELMA